MKQRLASTFTGASETEDDNNNNNNNNSAVWRTQKISVKTAMFRIARHILTLWFILLIIVTLHLAVEGAEHRQDRDWLFLVHLNKVPVLLVLTISNPTCWLMGFFVLGLVTLGDISLCVYLLQQALAAQRHGTRLDTVVYLYRALVALLFFLVVDVRTLLLLKTQHQMLVQRSAARYHLPENGLSAPLSSPPYHQPPSAPSPAASSDTLQRRSAPKTIRFKEPLTF